MAVSTIFPSLLLVIAYYFSIFVTSNLSSPLPHCLENCGNTQITYPFGMGVGCFYPGFEINCKQNISFLAGSNLQLLEILPGVVRINSTPFIAVSTFMQYFIYDPVQINLPEKSPYKFSVKSNKFIVVGCNTSGSISGSVGVMNACASMCPQGENVVNGSCGHSCCQVDVPSITNSLNISVTVMLTPTNFTQVSLLGYGFVVEDGSYVFRVSDLWNFNHDIHMNLDWAIGKKNCSQVKNSSSICGENSSCNDSMTNSGYLCKCADGYRGNPYRNGPQGCQDFDECNSPSSPCVPGATCENRVPGYFCHCPEGTWGNGSTSGIGCRKHFPMVEIVIATVMCAGLLTPCMYWLYSARKKRHLRNLKTKYFRQNGGLLLQQYFSPSKGTAIKHIKIFSASELKKATSNYDSSRILGSGGQGTVYMGTQEDGSIIAIKKPEEVAEGQVDQFINELVILSQIDHKNIVKLLGCCLETQVPLLIYEFISGGTLYQKLHHDPNLTIQLSWKDRLRIAREIADALSYLHSCVSMPIFHRDVKSSNILLDENFTVKLADFGVSRLIPIDKIRVSTTVKGTIGYLDPEYFKTGKLTEKSDVYSFGVVLLELLSGRKPVQHQQTRDYSSLVLHFLSYVKRGNLLEVLDEGIVREAKMEDLLAVAKIARRCLSLRGEKRPTMKEVVQKLVCLG